MTSTARRKPEHQGALVDAYLKALARRADRAAPQTKIAIPTGIVDAGELRSVLNAIEIARRGRPRP